jgi:hypothetical protein
MINMIKTCVSYSTIVGGISTHVRYINGSLAPPSFWSDGCDDNSPLPVILSFVFLIGMIICIIGCCCYCRHRRRKINNAKIIVYSQQELDEKTINNV